MKLRWALRRIPKTVQNVVRDLRLGGRPLGGTVKSRYAHLGAHDVGNADYDDLAILFREAVVRPDDVIVDVGAGKGRAISWLVRAHPGNHVVGIELDPKICADTAARLRKHAQVEVLCGDAIELLPADGTPFYLFNPFDAAGVEHFRPRLAGLRAGVGRPRVVYYNRQAFDLFGGDPRFPVRRLEDPRLTL